MKVIAYSPYIEVDFPLIPYFKIPLFLLMFLNFCSKKAALKLEESSSIILEVFDVKMICKTGSCPQLGNIPTSDACEPYVQT